MTRAPRRVVLALTALALALLGGTTPVRAADGPADPHLTESAVTKTGDGRFADLSVTVGKTQHLGNEAVKVAWQWGGTDPGSHATADFSRWKYDYLQVFQCWGDPRTGPSREQCQYGSKYSTDSPYRQVPPFDFAPYNNVLSRIVGDVGLSGTRTGPQDPLEASDPDGLPGTEGQGTRGRGIVPLHAAPSDKYPDGQRLALDTDTADTGELFDQFGSNEIPLARTNSRGSGEVYFEAQTTYQSQFLGCGDRLGSGSDVAGRPCFLVVVPRDATEVDGTDLRAAEGSAFLASSPLSLSNWQHRIVFPLQFDPVAQPCTLGGVERPVVGHESLGAAMRSWQSSLCASGQGYFYATVTDDIARSTAAGDLPKLSVVTDPVPGTTVPSGGGALQYAPVAASGVSIGFFVERVYSSQKPDSVRANGGTRVERMRLNQRLVAKLLTESYRYSSITRDDGPPHLAANPRSLVDDPEFRQLNQDLVGSLSVTDLDNVRGPLARLFVPADASDAVRELWTWILADPQARAFLDGTADPWGMKVSAPYEGLDRYLSGGVARADVPRLEDYCADIPLAFTTGETYPVCALDAAPYVASFDDGAALVGRGQPKGSESPYRDPNTGLVKLPKPAPQVVGTRALLTLTDTPSAELRGLVQAALPNADGRYVTPTRESMAAAVDQARAGEVPTVSRVDPTKVRGDGYPLTRLSYAVTNGALLDAEARRDYASFITVVTTSGQVPGTEPGTLPLGYAPLTKTLRARAAATATAIRTATLPREGADGGEAGSGTSGGGGALPVDGSTGLIGPDGDPVPVAAGPVNAAAPVGLDAAAPATPTGGALAALAAMTPFAGGTGWLVPLVGLAGLGLLVASRLLLHTGPLLPARWPRLPLPRRSP